MRLIFDIESNGLLDTGDKVHVIVLKDVETGIRETFAGPGRVLECLGVLGKATELIGHFILGFDLPFLQKAFGWAPAPGVLITDTLVMSRLIYSDIKERDFMRLKKNPMYLPGKLIGTHSLEAWGRRLGYHKGDYAASMAERGLDPWAELNDEMVAYCENDVELTHRLYVNMTKQPYDERALSLEHAVFKHCAEQEAVGVGFNEEKAVALYAVLQNERAALDASLADVFEPWFAPVASQTVKRSRKVFILDEKGPVVRGIPKTKDYERGRYEYYEAGAVITKVVYTQFSPSSRDHIANRLKRIYGWEPTEFTDGGKPKIDDEVLQELPYPEAKKLARYFLLEKRLGMIADGKNAWLKCVRNGRIHGRVNTNGAITGRATHSAPNLGQVPSGTSEHGPECRELFEAFAGWVFCGADASGLELRCLAHYMAQWDGGAYANEVLHGDVHWANVIALGLFPVGTVRNKHNPEHEAARALAKTFIYAFLYGAGDEKLGSIVGGGKAKGKELRARFLAFFPALATLISAVKFKAKRDGYVRGLDGRLLWIRSEHAALNTLLQGAGAVIMKQAMVNYHKILADLGMSKRLDYNQVLWVHDEFQLECRTPEIAEICGNAMVDGIRKVTKDFNFRCLLDGEYRVGNSWRETH